MNHNADIQDIITESVSVYKLDVPGSERAGVAAFGEAVPVLLLAVPVDAPVGNGLAALVSLAVCGPDDGAEGTEEEAEESVDVSAERREDEEDDVSEDVDADEEVGSVPVEPPANVESCAKPTEGGLNRKTEYTFFYCSRYPYAHRTKHIRREGDLEVIILRL